MVLRIHNVGKWSRLESGQALSLPGERRRSIRIHFNAEALAAVHLTDSDGSVTFLASFSGLQVVEFTAGGSSADGVRFADLLLTATSEGDVWYYTDDGEHIGFERDPRLVPFVEVAMRRERNPELERMMFMQDQNFRRREKLLQSQMVEFQAQMDAARAALGAAADAGPSVDAGGTPDAGAPATGAPAAND